MDPVTIISLVEGSLSLALQCGSVAKRLNSLVGQYTHAKLTISSMVQSLEIMQLAWNRIGIWSKNYVPTEDDGLMQRLDRFLETGSLVLDSLEEDLRSYDASNVTFRQRSRLMWNESIVQGHQNRIRDQAQSMSLLLQAIQLPTPQATTNLLQQSEKQFMKSDESAFSIVPSQLSSRLSLSTNQSSHRYSISSRANMEYRRLSFEDELFTARVYKRNYRNPRLQIPQGYKLDTERAANIRQRDIHRTQMKYHKLKLSVLDSRFTTSVIATGQAAYVSTSAVHVTTAFSTSDEKIVDDMEHRIGPSRLGQTGILAVKLTQYLEYPLNSAVSDAYVNLVVACERGDNDSVKRQLAMLPIITPGDSEASTLLGSYLSGSLYFCPVHAAIFNGHVEVMQTLLRRAAKEQDIGSVIEKAIGGTEYDPWRPLHVATMKGNLPMVELLLENGAFIHSKTGLGIRPIHLAAKFGFKDILMALLRKRADPNQQDRDGLQPLDYATSSFDVFAVINVFARGGVGVHGTSKKDKLTMLHVACGYDFIGEVEALLDSHSVHRWPDFNSALDVAIRHGSTMSVEALLRHGMRWKHWDPKECTGLETFAEKFYTSHSTSSHDKWSKERILRILLRYISPVDLGWDGKNLLESSHRIEVGQKEAVTDELAQFIWENLSEVNKLKIRVAEPYVNGRGRLIKIQSRPRIRCESLNTALRKLYEAEETSKGPTKNFETSTSMEELPGSI